VRMIIARPSLRRKVQTISPFLRGQCPATKHPRRTGSGGLGTFGDLGSNVCTQNQVTAKKILEVRLAQRRVARGMRDRDVAEPVLNRPGVDAVIGQLIATAVPQHVEMHRQSKAGTLADDLDQAERAKLCKRMPQLSCKPPWPGYRRRPPVSKGQRKASLAQSTPVLVTTSWRLPPACCATFRQSPRLGGNRSKRNLGTIRLHFRSVVPAYSSAPPKSWSVGLMNCSIARAKRSSERRFLR
jgi:hypothetical protein